MPIAERHKVVFGPRGLSFPDADGSHLPTSLRIGADEARNPTLPTLWRGVEVLLAEQPDLIALLLVHPEQRVGAPVLAHLLRQAGYAGQIVLFGALEDVLSVEDLAPDLLGQHDLWHLVDAVVLGDAEAAIDALACGTRGPIPNVLRAGDSELPTRTRADLNALALPDFSGFQPAIYPFPTPVVDIRVGRGCPWARCAFCAIQAHQPGWRTQSMARVVQTMAIAHQQLGCTWFRIRDDLLTPTQLRDMGQATSALAFKPRWTARARFSPQLSASVLEQAAAGGLMELWLGLESAVPRVRQSMDKGVRQDTVLRVLNDCAAAGIRVRALCLLGFPGETQQEAEQTLLFLDAHLHLLTSFALTPFQLMRNSPMALDLDRWGAERMPDPIPKHERLRHDVLATLPDTLPTALVKALIRQAGERFFPKMQDPWGPTAMHRLQRATARAHAAG
jgi:hypothetical protein